MANSLITDITVYDNGGEEWVSITVKGCVNYTKAYGLFGHHEEVSKRAPDTTKVNSLNEHISVLALDGYAARPAMGRAASLLRADGGVETFRFKKPATDRFFFHARQMD